eukprot:1983714-Rhodomonas_salina.2
MRRKLGAVHASRLQRSEAERAGAKALCRGAFFVHDLRNSGGALFFLRHGIAGLGYGEPRGFGFVVMESSAAASRAMSVS